jgi:ATP-binding cassette, subfamily C (CFTR/MRP), member 1
LSIAYINLCNKLKFRYSTIMFLYWLLMALANAITLRTHLIQQIKSKDKSANLELYIFYVYYALILANLILSTFSEKYSEEKNKNIGSVKSNVNLLSNLTFWWSNYLISVGFKRDLTYEDLFEIEHKHKSNFIIEKLDKEWTKMMLIYFKKLNLLNDGFISKTKRKVVPSEPSLSICLIKLFGTQFIGTLCITITSHLLMYAQPLLIDRLINFIKDKEHKSNTIGFFYIFILLLTSFSRTLNTLHYQYGDFIIGQQMKIGLQNLIFRKSLKLSSSARKETTVGEMVIIWAHFYLCFLKNFI